MSWKCPVPDCPWIFSTITTLDAHKMDHVLSNAKVFGTKRDAPDSPLSTDCDESPLKRIKMEQKYTGVTEMKQDSNYKHHQFNTSNNNRLFMTMAKSKIIYYLHTFLETFEEQIIKIYENARDIIIEMNCDSTKDFINKANYVTQPILFMMQLILITPTSYIQYQVNWAKIFKFKDNTGTLLHWNKKNITKNEKLDIIYNIIKTDKSCLAPQYVIANTFGLKSATNWLKKLKYQMSAIY